jgi:hypothetical protein
MSPSLSAMPSEMPSESPSFFPFAFILDGNSTIVEDVYKTIGADITWTRRSNRNDTFIRVTVFGFPDGTNVTYTDINGTVISVIATANYTVVIAGGLNEASYRNAVDSLSVTASAHTDVNFDLTVEFITRDPLMYENDENVYTHPVIVQAVADPPTVSANDIIMGEDNTSVPLEIFADRSSDNDNSETLSVCIFVPSDGVGPIATLSPLSNSSGITFTDFGNATYCVVALGPDPASREATLDDFLEDSIIFLPRPQWSGVLNGTAGIRVIAISTENANGAELAPNNSPADGTVGDADTKIEIAETYIDVAIIPLVDLPTLNSTSSIFQENNNVSSSDPDLVIDIGNQLGMTIVDLDGSQSLNLTLTGFPTTALDLTFNGSIPGVFVTTNVTTGTATIYGTNSADVLQVLSTLQVTLFDDDDENFDIVIDGVTTDTNGVFETPPVSFTLIHNVTVQAVADTPTVDRGSVTKPEVAENSNFVAYPVTIALNDTDGSEDCKFDGLRLAPH